jgi:membrane-bound metal-dependent hydrolase YbcI (DUF457 family)
MFIGHFGVGFAAQRVAPRLSLGTAFLSAQWVDLVWPFFLLLGWETVRIQAGATAVTPLVFEHYPITHSLVGVICWALLLGTVYALWRKDARGAAVVGLLVVSHWVLDAIVHVPDLPITAGGTARVGLALWNSVPATLAVEVPLFAIGVWLYARGTWSRMDAVGRWAFGGLVAFLAVIQASNLAGPPPPSVTAIAWVGQAQWLLVAWGYWVESRVRRALPP